MLMAIFVFVTAFLLLVLIAFFGMDFAVMRQNRPMTIPNKKISESSFDTLYGKNIDEGKRWVSGLPYSEETIKAYDGTRLCGRFYRNGDSKMTVLLMHGYRSNPMHDFSCAFKFYFDKGFNLCVPDQRAHGQSEGRFITYGIRERFDAKSWMEHINTLVEGGEIYAYGVSMGASTLLMASSLELPENLKGIIADCGFTSPGAIIKKVIKEDMRLPVFPFYFITRLMTRIVAGFDFEEYSAITAVEQAHVPIFMLHGKADCFVPFSMGEEIFEAARGKKQAVWVEGADHGCSFMTDPDTCTNALYGFFGV